MSFQRLAIFAFITVELLIFVGAVVRVSGSGLGCPDWPFCYGCWVPPRSAEEIDFTKLDLEKFRRKAAQHGRDPAAITAESIRAEFDPVSTWVEYFNRLTSLPVGFSVLALAVVSWRLGRWHRWVSGLALFLVLVNAWMGARVVWSGLLPGIITIHMALAMLLLCVLVYAAWASGSPLWRLPQRGRAYGWGLALFSLVVLEAVMGSQVREHTDELARSHVNQSRAEWVGELEHTWMYLCHRSFSWLIVIGGLGLYQFVRVAGGGVDRLEWGILGIIGIQMCLGVVLSQVGVVPWAQVLHVGLSSLLLSGCFCWLLVAREARLEPVAT
jgi:heme a synthase